MSFLDQQSRSDVVDVDVVPHAVRQKSPRVRSERHQSAALAANMLLGIELSPSEQDLLSRLATETNPQAGYLKRKMREDFPAVSPKAWYSQTLPKQRDRSRDKKKKTRSKESASVDRKQKKEKEKERGKEKEKSSVASKNSPGNKLKKYGQKGSEPEENSEALRKAEPEKSPDMEATEPARTEQRKNIRFSRSRKAKKLPRQDSDTSSESSSKGDSQVSSPELLPVSRREKISGFLGSVIQKGKKTFHRDPKKKDRGKSTDSNLSNNVFDDSGSNPTTPETTKAVTSGGRTAMARSSGNVQDAGVQTLRETGVQTIPEPGPQSRSGYYNAGSGALLARARSLNTLRHPSGPDSAQNVTESPTLLPLSSKMPKAAARRQFFASMKSTSLGKEPTGFSGSPTSPLASTNSGSDVLEADRDKTPDTPDSIALHKRHNDDQAQKQRDEILLKYYRRESSRVTPGNQDTSDRHAPEKPVDASCRTERSPVEVLGRGVARSPDPSQENDNFGAPVSNKGVISSRDNVTGDKVIDKSHHSTKPSVTRKENKIGDKDSRSSAQDFSVPDSKTQMNKRGVEISKSSAGSNLSNTEKWYDNIRRSEKGRLSKQTTEDSEILPVSDASEQEYDSPMESSFRASPQVLRGPRLFSAGFESDTTYLSAESVVHSPDVEHQQQTAFPQQTQQYLNTRRGLGRKPVDKARSLDSADVDPYVTSVVEQEHTRAFTEPVNRDQDYIKSLRAKLQDQKHSSDTDEGIVKDKMENTKKQALTIEVDEKNQAGLSSPPDSALGTPSSSVVSSVKVDESALEDIQQELAQAFDVAPDSSGNSAGSGTSRPSDEHVIPDGVVSGDRDQMDSGKDAHVHVSLSEADLDGGRIQIPSAEPQDTGQDSQLGSDAIVEGEKPGELSGFECIPESCVGIPSMEYVSGADGANETSDTPHMESLAVLPSNRPILSPVNELTEENNPSAESTDPDKAINGFATPLNETATDDNNIANKDIDNVHVMQDDVAFAENDISPLESPQLSPFSPVAPFEEGGRYPESLSDPDGDSLPVKNTSLVGNYIKEESMLTVDSVVLSAVVAQRAKNKFLSLLDAKPLPYEPVFNLRAHPYKNLRTAEDEDEKPVKPVAPEDIKGPEDPEDDNYEPTNMIDELVLLKSSGFDINEEKVHQLQLEIEDDEKKKIAARAEEAKRKEEAKRNDEREKLGQNELVQDENAATAEQEEGENESSTMDTLQVPKGKRRKHKKTKRSRVSSSSSSDGGDARTETDGSQNSDRAEDRMAPEGEKQNETLASMPNGTGSSVRRKKSEATAKADKVDASVGAGTDKEVPLASNRRSLPQNLQSKPETTQDQSGSVRHFSDSVATQTEDLSLSEGLIRFEVMDAGAAADLHPGTAPPLQEHHPAAANSEYTTDEPVFVISTFDTFLQQLYVNMGTFGPCPSNLFKIRAKTFPMEQKFRELYFFLGGVVF